MNSKDIEAVEQALAYQFRNKELLIRSLTRKAFALEQKQQGTVCEDQELYRILGDAVLKLILVEMLIEDGHDSRDSITQEKGKLESRENLGKILKELGLFRFICFGKGEKKQDIANQSSVRGETFEAIVAAIYLDLKDYEKTKDHIVKLFRESISLEDRKSSSNQNSANYSTSQLLISFDACEACFDLYICSKLGMCYLEFTAD